MGERYLYMVCRDGKIPSLIRLGSFARMEADLYAYPGVWKDTPHLNDIRVGKGCFMDYDDVSDEEAEEIRLQIHEDAIRKEIESLTPGPSPKGEGSYN